MEENITNTPTPTVPSVTPVQPQPTINQGTNTTNQISSDNNPKA